MHTIEKVWDYNGLKCVVLMNNNSGHRCGYVGLPLGNPYFGLHHDRPEVSNMNVHGGLTFSSGNPGEKYPIKTPIGEFLWWFGYDCGHFQDGLDMTVMPEKAAAIHRKYHDTEEYPIRSLDYCIKECENLADQLASVPEESIHGAN